MIRKPITRRDFLNGSAIGVGAALLQSKAPGAFGANEVMSWQRPVVGADWYGYGGVGDYATSHGNTPDVVTKAHALRDGAFAGSRQAVIDLPDRPEVVIVGAGMAGLGAAWHFREVSGSRGHCLLIDNHPVFGGVAKQNEFTVDGERLIAPQGANGFSVPDFDNEDQDFAGGDAFWYRRLGVPEAFDYAAWSSELDPIRFGGDHYGFIHWLQQDVTTGRFYGKAGERTLVVDPMRDAFARAPITAPQREALRRWLTAGPATVPGDVNRWLDSMTYRHYLEQVLGLDPYVTRYINPVIASGIGLGADCVSAYACMNVALPGFSGISSFSIGERHSFPGGNGGFARYFLKRLIPEAIAGDESFGAIIGGRLEPAAFDRAGQPVRLRLGATVVSVEHDDDGGVTVVYAQGDRLYRIRTRGVVMAGGGWMNKHVVSDLPAAHRKAYDSFNHAPMLVANVALHNWRFMYRAGISACLYEGDFGFECNIRRPMHAGSYQPPLHPDKPTVLTFYVPFPFLGMETRAQASRGRNELYFTDYAGYEQRIIGQLVELFGDYGFSAERDVAGIILNRWGHAYIVPEPGFFFGRGGAPAARDVIRTPHGRIAFGHSELRGNQHWGPAAMEGRRAMQQVLEAIAA